MTGLAVLQRRNTTPDGVLVQEAAAGSGVSYGALYDRYATQVFNYCLRLTGSPEDAGDATQEAFLNVLRRLQDDDRPVLDFSSYLFAAARHESYALMRQRTRTHPSDSPPAERGRVADLDTDPERSVLLRDSQEAVRVANSQLPPRHREVLALREVAGRSYEEIGATMGISENAAAQLIWRARSKLREAMTAGAVASVVATSEECETAQMLLSRVQDGEPVEEADRVWLEEHLDECGSCKTANRMLLEVGASYRLWLPVALFAGMRTDTLTRAGEVVGADWSHVPAPGKGAAGSSGGGGAGAAAATVVVIAAAAIGSLAVLRDDDPSPVDSGPDQPAASAAAGAEKNAPARDRADEPGAAGAVFLAARAPRSEFIPALGTSPDQPPNRADGRAAPDAPRHPGAPAPRQDRPGPPADRPTQPPGGSPGPDSPAPTEPRAGPSPPSAPEPRDTAPVKPTPPAPSEPSVDPAPPPPPPPPPPTGCSWPGGGGGPGGCPPGHGGVPPGQGGTPPGRMS